MMPQIGLELHFGSQEATIWITIGGPWAQVRGLGSQGGSQKDPSGQRPSILSSVCIPRGFHCQGISDTLRRLQCFPKPLCQVFHGHEL